MECVFERRKEREHDRAAIPIKRHGQLHTFVHQLQLSARSQALPEWTETFSHYAGHIMQKKVVHAGISTISHSKVVFDKRLCICMTRKYAPSRSLFGYDAGFE